MAAARHSRSVALPVVALAALAAGALWTLAPAAFAPSPASLRGAAGQPMAAAAAAAAAAALPDVANALPDVELDVGSSVSLAGLTEVLMCGIVMGVVPTTILGLLVAAWLQFKKGPTLGL
mmetsp:Transcript_3163/g.6417  ORF Transcript_3163/g.6417 Transcript_3163/m.6417 type:complete len:120 (-) Transcript_3163:151-510(-)